MNRYILNQISLDSGNFQQFSKNHLLKDLRIPVGYFVNNIPPKRIPIIYNHYSDHIDNKDDKCIDKCLKLVEAHKYSPKTKNNKPKKRRKTRKNNFRV